jgi:hypothetical protein
MYRSLLCLAVLIACLGCGDNIDERAKLPPTSPVSGHITLDGQPVEGVVVTFIPTGDTKGIECVGRTDESGIYTPTQIRGSKGVPPGNYKVVFSRLTRGGKPIAPDEQTGAGGIAIESLPAKYSVPNNSKETATVPEGGGEINFQLTSK